MRKDQQLKLLKSFASAKGIEIDLLDFEALIDSKLSYPENKSALNRLFIERGLIQAKPISQEAFNAQRIEREKEIFDGGPQSTPNVPPIAQYAKRYEPIYQAIRQMDRGYLNLLIVRGRGGTGKSHSIKNALLSCKKKYVEITKITEASIPLALWENPESIIWVKDAIKIFNNPQIMDILKSATEMNGERKIRIDSFSQELKRAGFPLKESFSFKGAFIFDYNNLSHMNYLDDFNALISRGKVVDVVFSHDEICETMRSISKTEEEKLVTEFLIENYRYVGYNSFNLRTQQHAFNLYKFCIEDGLDWKAELKSELQRLRSPIFSMLYQFLGKSPLRSTQLKRMLIMSGMCETFRTADRRIFDWIEMEELFKVTSEDRNYMVSLFPVNISTVWDTSIDATLAPGLQKEALC